MDVEIEVIDPAAAADLIDELDAYQKTLYPPESNHLDSIDTLKQSNVCFLGAIEAGDIIAIGSVKIFDDYGELKRIYVPKRHRGKGLAQRIVRALEQELLTHGVGVSRLETGPKSVAAIRLYEKLGYVERGPFGSYPPDPLSTFMEKHL